VLALHASSRRSPGFLAALPGSASGTCRRQEARCPADTRARFAHCASAVCWLAPDRRPAFAWRGEAITTVGALDHGLRGLGWDAAICVLVPESWAPAPRSDTAACPPGLGSCRPRARRSNAAGARMSSGDPRAPPRHLPHTLTVLDLLLEPVTVGAAAGMRSPVGRICAPVLGAVFGGALPSRPALELDVSVPRASPP